MTSSEDTIRAYDLDAAAYVENGAALPDSVRRDITPAFVTLLRAQGYDADVLDPLTDDLGSADGGYDAVWANASLLHVARADLPTVLSRLGAVVASSGTSRAERDEPRSDGCAAGEALRGWRQPRRKWWGVLPIVGSRGHG